MSKVDLEGISKTFGKKTILSDINLSIEDKEFCVLVGASGCGKSTLLRMIAGLETPDSGNLYIDGKLSNNIHPKDRNIAFVFQSYALYPHLSVYDNIAFPLKLRKMKKNDIKKKVEEASEILGLGEYLKRKPKELSGGQRQRVALGRAIVREPEVFLMDEPLSNLDAKLRVQMRYEIKKLHEKLDTTFIYVTHDQTEALTMGDKIVILNEGKIQQAGSAEDIFNYPANTFVATFMGNMPMNIIPAVLNDNVLCFDRVMITLNEFNKNLLGDRKKILVGIRPESFEPHFVESIIPTGIRMHVNIDEIETIGGERHIHFKLDETPVVAKVSSKINIGAAADFTIDISDLHFFDIETKQRIV